MTALCQHPRNLLQIVDAYLTARERVIEAGFADEIDWQDSRDPDRVDESEFLRQAAWVILSAGIAESVVRRVFPSISCAFCSWSSAEQIAAEGRYCVARARLAFNHIDKLEAILSVAHRLTVEPFALFKSRLLAEGPEVLTSFDYIGPVTCLHLAKNLGMDCAKPDRHLMRTAKAAWAEDAAELCAALSAATGDRVATVDLVLWRYATIEPEYEHLFHCAAVAAACAD